MNPPWGAALELLELVDYSVLRAPTVNSQPVSPAPAPKRPIQRQDNSPVLRLVDSAPATPPPPAPAQEARPLPPQSAAQPAPLRGMLTFYSAGRLLVIDDSAPTFAAAGAQLLAKVLSAARQSAISAAPESIRWPLPGLPEGSLADARDYTGAYLSSRRERTPFDDVWLMGELPLACVGPSDTEFLAMLGRELPGVAGATLRVLPNLQSMLENPSAKATCWQALKRFYGLE